MEEAGILTKTIVKEKPLHIEYHLSERGMAMIPIFKDLESLLQ
jgi:DNA-binding HxlR family transcriptional regulator